MTEDVTPATTFARQLTSKHLALTIGIVNLFAQLFFLIIGKLAILMCIDGFIVSVVIAVAALAILGFLASFFDEVVEYLLIKVLSEMLAVSDTQTVVFAANKSDNAVLSSSGSLLMQDYCDITYFLEDYVGTSRTFT